jgi:signal transduction histidine kinase
MTQAYQELSVDHQYVKHTLNETEENLRELVSFMPAAVYACDREGFLTYYNRQAIEIWGRTPCLDDPPWSFLDLRRMYRLDGTLLTPDETPVRSVLATGVSVINCELILERPDLSRINVLANIAALRDSTGQIAGAVSIFQDIVELKRTQQERDVLLQELERSNRELSQFSYAVSHDLRAPVHHVRGLTQLIMRRETSLKEESTHLLTLIDRAAAGMENLIESLLRYAQAGHGELNSQRFQVDTVVHSLCVTLEPLIKKTSARIICKSLSEVEADPVLLEELLQNLVANAIQYHRAEESPVVEISIETSADGWQFSVRDNGQGIPSDYQNGIFEPFKRLHGHENPGTGLGLALCRTIVSSVRRTRPSRTTPRSTRATGSPARSQPTSRK